MMKQLGAANVLEVDAAEARFEQFDRVDERLQVFGLELKVDRIDIGEALEQHRLAFHRLRGERAEIARARIAVPFEITATRLPLAV